MIQQRFATTMQYCNVSVKSFCNISAIFLCCIRKLKRILRNFLCKKRWKEVVLLLMLKLLRKVRNVSSWHAIRYLRVGENFIYNILLQQQKYTRKQKFWIEPKFTRMRCALRCNLVLEMQKTIVRNSSITSE